MKTHASPDTGYVWQVGSLVYVGCTRRSPTYRLLPVCGAPVFSKTFYDKEVMVIKVSIFDEPIADLTKAESYTDKEQIAYMLSAYLEKAGKRVQREDADALEAFVFPEMEKLIDRIPKTKTFREKSVLFEYASHLMEIFAFLGSKTQLGTSDTEVAKTLAFMVDREQWLPMALGALFEAPKAEKAAVDAVIEKVRALSDESHRGVLWEGLLHFQKDLGKLTADAKESIAAFMREELARYAGLQEISDDACNSFELLADICDSFADDEILSLLSGAIGTVKNNVRFYILRTLLAHGKTVPQTAVEALAEDLEYAELTYRALEQHRQTDLFPAKFADPEYLAKSDMVHWLVYPTELGQRPDEIECIGTVKVKRSLYHVFKFKSSSDTLSEEDKNKWLIGWSSPDGGTFSNFDSLADYEKGTPEKTLKYIRKKLIG